MDTPNPTTSKRRKAKTDPDPELPMDETPATPAASSGQAATPPRWWVLNPGQLRPRGQVPESQCEALYDTHTQTIYYTRGQPSIRRGKVNLRAHPWQPLVPGTLEPLSQDKQDIAQHS